MASGCGFSHGVVSDILLYPDRYSALGSLFLVTRSDQIPDHIPCDPRFGSVRVPSTPFPGFYRCPQALLVREVFLNDLRNGGSAQVHDEALLPTIDYPSSSAAGSLAMHYTHLRRRVDRRTCCSRMYLAVVGGDCDSF